MLDLLSQAGFLAGKSATSEKPPLSAAAAPELRCDRGNGCSRHPAAASPAVAGAGSGRGS